MSDDKLFFHGASGMHGGEVTSPLPLAARNSSRLPRCLLALLLLLVPQPCSPQMRCDEDSSPPQVPTRTYFCGCSSSWHVLPGWPLYARILGAPHHHPWAKGLGLPALGLEALEALLCSFRTHPRVTEVAPLAGVPSALPQAILQRICSWIFFIPARACMAFLCGLCSPQTHS